MSALRGQTVAPQQSRPTIRDRTGKKTGLWKRLSLSPKAKGGSDTPSPSAAMSPSAFPPFRPSTPRAFRSRRFPATTSSSNLMQWLQEDCPQDLLPRILAYAGPQMTANIAKTNRFWTTFIKKESTWRTLCEELYKWKEGEAVPASWREYYKRHPCVPVDYPTISAAFAVVRSSRMEQTRSICILLRPGKYILREAITVQAPSNVKVEMRTMEMPDSFNPIEEAPEEIEPARKRKSSSAFRNMLGCRSVDVEEADEEIIPEFSDPTPNHEIVSSSKRAALVMRTRRHNEPILRIHQGSVALKNLDLRHISHGIDIWNGNAAIQIQPPIGPDDRPLMVVPAPTALLENVEISSASGRGIVNIDGGHVTIRSCYVHDCAATGIYVGGPGSRATIERTDVIRNGNGNSQHRRGIARGHSGVYLEQGLAHIKDCNISENSLTGISAVSPENAVLNLEESELVSNGTMQLEMPPVGSHARRLSSTQNNTMAPTGLARSRSGLLITS